MRFAFFYRLIIILCGTVFTSKSAVYAQCVTPIATFPYIESFELNDGGWVAGGSASDWAWGTPAKPVITGAAAGINCWITGGLNGSSYNNSENSWLQSPCFDFTTLVNPRISFSIFWETEKRFDGASMQYSIDGGINWLLLGSINDNSCIATNWYNNASINFLGGTNGWSGTIQPAAGGCVVGNGSNGWLPAMHDLSFLAGQSSVTFRFRFAAGTTCNGYDGFAIDELIIDETPPNSGDFTYACNGNRSVTFTSTASLCATNYAWNFNDPASGPNNTSSIASPTHIFSSAGIYTVSLTITFATGPNVVVFYTIEILDVTINQLITINCNGNSTGAIVAIVSGGSGSYNYTWNTVPPQTTFDLNNIGAGSYTVLVSSASACATTAMYTLVEPAPFNIETIIKDAVCNNDNGSIVATVTGGTSPYLYTWSNGGTLNTINNLPGGSYSLNILDANGCPSSVNNLIVNKNSTPITVTLGNDITACPGQRIILNPGTFNSYLWQDNSINPTFNVTQSGTYWVTVSNGLGCSGTDTIKVKLDCSDLYFPGAFTPNKDGRNDDFGPIGSQVALVRNYSLRIYNRYGQMIFYSTDPYKKWDGTLKGAPFSPGTYTWYSTYNISAKASDMQTGTVILIR